MSGFDVLCVVLTNRRTRRAPNTGSLVSKKFSSGVILYRLVDADRFLFKLKQALLWLGGGTGGEEPPEATVQVGV